MNLAIFVSGGGSNARKIIEHFEKKPELGCRVALIVSNKKDAGALDIAREHGIATHVLARRDFYETENLLDVLRQHEVGFIALAGFLWLAPPYLVRAFERRMVNIHPALLPKFGGKGMFGMHVHEAVRAANEPETGMTIHYVTEHYDEGAAIFQARCPVAPTDSAADIARNVLALEHRHFPEVLEGLLKKQEA